MRGGWKRCRKIIDNHASGEGEGREHVYQTVSLNSQEWQQRAYDLYWLKTLDLLRFGRASGLTSPSRTTFSDWSLSTKLRNLARLILPIGRSSIRTLAGAAGDKGSKPILTLGICWPSNSLLLGNERYEFWLKIIVTRVAIWVWRGLISEVRDSASLETYSNVLGLSIYNSEESNIN